MADSNVSLNTSKTIIVRLNELRRQKVPDEVLEAVFRFQWRNIMHSHTIPEINDVMNTIVTILMRNQMDSEMFISKFESGSDLYPEFKTLKVMMEMSRRNPLE